MSQTTVQKRETIRYGSAKVEIGERLDKLVDVGAARSVSVKETLTSQDIESDNAGTVSTLLSEHKMEVSLDSLEINLEKYVKMRGGIDKINRYDGKTLVTREYIVSSATYEKNEEIRIPFETAQGTSIAIVKVETLNGGARREVEAAGYEKVGTDRIKIKGDSVRPSSDTLVITFTYTPKKMVRMTTGGGSTSIKPGWIKITNENAEGKKFIITCPQASITNGLEFAYSGDKANDVMVNKLSFSATIDSKQKSGEQLAWYDDEQAVEEEENTDVADSPVTPPEKEEEAEL